jgi:magnesium transporter
MHSEDVVKGFAPFIDRVENGVKGVFTTRPGNIGLALRRIYLWRREIIRIHLLLGKTNDVFRSFARHHDAYEASPARVTLYMSDLQGCMLAMNAKLDWAEQMLSSSQSRCPDRLLFNSTRLPSLILAVLGRLTIIAVIVVCTQLAAAHYL